MLQMEHVIKQYPNFRLDCSLEVEPGRVVGLIGRNGAGKTTVFKTALGLIRSDSGRITILGRDAGSLTEADRARMGVVLADSGFSGYLNIHDLIPMLRNLYQRFDETFFLKKCGEFRLPLKKNIREFSTGMKRRLQLIAALSHNADFLILDEPTSGMDVLAREECLDMLREFMETENRSILISSHISSDLEGICDEICMIDEGTIILREDTDTLLGCYGLLKLTEEQYQKIDRSYILRQRKEEYGFCCLTKERQFYLENYPDLVIEKGTIDEVIAMMAGGAKR